MAKTLAETDAALDELAAELPRIMSDSGEVYLMDEVMGLADVIEERAASEDRSHVRSRVQCILRDAGLIPGDDEPCAD